MLFLRWSSLPRGIYALFEVELMDLVFTCMPSESYRRRLLSLLWCLFLSSTNQLPCLLVKKTANFDSTIEQLRKFSR